MASIHDSYVGFAEETTYGVAVAPNRFIEMVSESFAGDYQRINSEAYRAGQRVLHKDRFVPNPKGAAGELRLEGQDRGLGLLLKHMFGAVASGEPDIDGFTTHTVSIADLKGKSLTFQVGRVDNNGTLHAFTYEGGKVASWEITNGVDGVLNLGLTMDFAREIIGSDKGGAYVPVAPTYPEDSQLFTFVSGHVEIGGAAFGVGDISLRGNNNLKTDRWFTTGKREPTEEANREYEFELRGEFEGLTHAQRIAAEINAQTMASLVLRWDSPQGGELEITAPFARFDSGPVNFDSARVIEQSLSGIIVWDGSTSPLTVAYKSLDETL